MLGTEIAHEQAHLDLLYTEVDRMRAELAALPDPDHSPDPDAESAWRSRQAARLGAVEQGLCFGRIDLDGTADGDVLHIGRMGLFRDSDDATLLLDWRAPAARPFYTATARSPQGVRRRRRISTEGRTVVDLDDELLTAGPADAGDLTGEAALLAAVTAGRGERMRDIVATLQAEQDQIIRSPQLGVLVVDGGPGTGKTAVALHRAAYLLYTRRHLLDRGVLVVGPNRVYLDYIGQVLPGLGEDSVLAATVVDLLPGTAVDLVDPPITRTVKGGAAMAGRLAAAVRARVVVPTEPVEVPFEDQTLRLDPAAVRRALRVARRSGLPHNRARHVFAREFVELLVDRVVESMEAVALDEHGLPLDGGAADGRLSPADLRAMAAAGVVVGADDGPVEMVDAVDREALRTALLAEVETDAIWPSLSAPDLLAEVLADPGAHLPDLTADEVRALHRTSEGWSAADVPLLDELAALIGREPVTASGTLAERAAADPGWAFGHVVVDEAQELSEMAWRMLMRRCPSRSMTVVGDLAQVGDPAGATSWDRVLAPHVDDRWELVRLTVNYRTPSEIMDAATALLATYTDAGPGPSSIRDEGTGPWRVSCSPADLPGVVAELAADFSEGRTAVIAPSSWELPGPVYTPELAKGLEFDNVLIVDPAAILSSSARGANDLYVAMTRATHRLGLVLPGPVPEGLVDIPVRGV